MPSSRDIFVQAWVLSTEPGSDALCGSASLVFGHFETPAVLDSSSIVFSNSLSRSWLITILVRHTEVG